MLERAKSLKSKTLVVPLGGSVAICRGVAPWAPAYRFASAVRGAPEGRPYKLRHDRLGRRFDGFSLLVLVSRTRAINGQSKQDKYSAQQEYKDDGSE
jgi:hypothetical protein